MWAWTRARQLHKITGNKNKCCCFLFYLSLQNSPTITGRVFTSKKLGLSNGGKPLLEQRWWYIHLYNLAIYWECVYGLCPFCMGFRLNFDRFMGFQTSQSIDRLNPNSYACKWLPPSVQVSSWFVFVKDVKVCWHPQSPL